MRPTFHAALAIAALAMAKAHAADAPVTYARLLHPEPGNWLTVHKTYDAQRFSELAEITAGNVAGLRLVAALALVPPATTVTGNVEAFEATPLANNGILYITDGLSRLYRIDGRDPARPVIDWIVDPEVDRATIGIPANRGAALLGDRAYVAALDSRLLAVTTAGEIIWDSARRDVALQTTSAAPLALDGRILWSGGGDAGGRGWIEAVDAETGAALWHFDSVPGPGEVGHDTWANDSWRRGGGGVWQTGTFDPASGLTFWGVGNPFPAANPALRPGDNLFTDSVVALNAATGRLAWHFQYTPNDSWEFDAAGVQALLPGASGATLNSFQRNGFFYALDASTGAFLRAAPYLEEVNWTAGIDTATGKPLEYDPALAVQTYLPGKRRLGAAGEVVRHVCPEPQGGNTFFPISYSPRTRLLYSAQIEGCADLAPHARRLTQGGSVVALDPATGRTVRKVMKDYANYAGVTATAGGLVFTGYVDGTAEALDSETLDVRWSAYLGSPIAAAPMTYSAGGRQIVVYAVGGSPVPFTIFAYPGLTPSARPLPLVQPAKTLFFFAL